MGTHHTQTDSNDRQPPLIEVAVPAGIPIGKRLWLVDGDGQRAVFLGAVAIHVFDADDCDAERVCIAMLSKAGLAFDVEIGAAFGVHRNTVARLARQLAVQGLGGVVAAKRGPKGPHKVTGEVGSTPVAEYSCCGGFGRDAGSPVGLTSRYRAGVTSELATAAVPSPAGAQPVASAARPWQEETPGVSSNALRYSSHDRPWSLMARSRAWSSASIDGP